MKSNGATSGDQIGRLRKELFENPNGAKEIYELGREYLSRNDVGKAIAYLCQAVAADGKNPTYYTALGNGLLRTGKNLEAACAFRQALAIQGNLASAYCGLGRALRGMGDLELSRSAFIRTVKESPDNVEYLIELAALHNQTHQYAAAYNAAKRAISLTERPIDVYIHLVESLFGRRKISRGLSILRQNLSNHPDWADGYHNMGRGLMALGKFKKAENHYRKALARAPLHANAHFGLATALLANGGFTEGWKEYEWRFKLDNHAHTLIGRFSAELTEPVWNGEDLKGKTLLVYGEQGFGDTFQSLRYVPELEKRGCRIILMVYRELVGLLKAMPSVSLVIPYNDLIPRYDYHIPIFSLPRLLNTTIDTIPATTPYIPAPKGQRKLIRPRDRSSYRVGFIRSTRVLSTFDRRSVPIESFERLFSVQSAAFYNLQINDSPKDLKPYLAKYRNLHPPDTTIKSWEETAHIISQMDLIISIDTAIAHLAGSLNKPVWLILPRDGEWRWLSGAKGSRWADKSPWYPSMRLFRSSSFVSWTSVIERVRTELIREVGTSSRVRPGLGARQAIHASG